MQRIIGLIICSLLVLAVPARAQFISGNCGSSSIPCDVTLTSGSATIGTVTQGTAASSGPWIFTPWIAGAVNSATNGTYSDLLQGNAVLSATNGLFSNILQGNAVLTGANPIFAALSIGGAVNSATNGLYTNLLQGNAVISGTNPIPIAETYANIATNQVTVGTSATLIVAARTGRKNVTIFQEGNTLVRVGASGVTLGTGVPLIGTQGANIPIDGGAAVYGIAGSSELVSFMEVY